MLFQLTPAAMPDGYGEALVSLPDAKAWLGIEQDETDFDLIVAALRDGAIDGVEQHKNEFFGPRTGLTATFSSFGPGMRIGRHPLATLAITSISYIGSDGSTIGLTPPSEGVAGDWRLDMSGGIIPAIGVCWPTTCGPVTVTYSAGYPEGACPKGRITACKMLLAFFFANRDGIVSSGWEGELPPGVILMAGPRQPLI